MSQQRAKQPVIDVRLATAEDLPVLQEREHLDAGLARRNLELQQAGDYFYVLGFIDGTFAGSVILDCREETELRPEMKEMLVYPEFRRQGLGIALSRFLERAAASQGFDEIKLAVDPDNPAAIPLYISLDYSPTGHHRTAVHRAVSDDGRETEREQRDAVYRKSLRISA